MTSIQPLSPNSTRFQPLPRTIGAEINAILLHMLDWGFISSSDWYRLRQEHNITDDQNTATTLDRFKKHAYTKLHYVATFPVKMMFFLAELERLGLNKYTFMPIPTRSLLPKLEVKRLLTQMIHYKTITQIELLSLKQALKQTYKLTYSSRRKPLRILYPKQKMFPKSHKNILIWRNNHYV